MSDHLIGIVIVIVCGVLGYVWKILQELIKDNEVQAIRIEHLEADNKQHKDNHSSLYEKLYAMVSDLKQDISDLKEVISKHTP